MKRRTHPRADELARVEDREIQKALNLPELVKSFLEAQDIRPISKRLYQRGVEKFLSWLETENVPQPDRGEVLKFRIISKDSTSRQIRSTLIWSRSKDSLPIWKE